MRFLVFATADEAAAAVKQIDANARVIFAAAGYNIDSSGNVVGKRLSDGANQPAAVTKTWDIPRQRLDGKWIVSHPENLPGAAKFLDQILIGVIFDSIEDYSDNWFPVAARFRP